MTFNPITKKLYSDSGEFIKRLHCPLKKRWDSLQLTKDNSKRFCNDCNHTVIDSSTLDDQSLAEIVKQDPDTCLKINLNQANLKVFTNGFTKRT